jgi:uncharacterized protein (TIGR00369 family)
MKATAQTDNRQDQIQPTSSGIMPDSAVAGLLGLRPISVGTGEAIIELEAGPQHFNPMGTLHGGILCDLADLAMGAAFASTLKDNETFTTLELKMNFLRPVWKDTLRAAARVANRGRTVGLVECEVSDSRGRLVAKSTSTCMTLPREKHPNR